MNQILYKLCHKKLKHLILNPYPIIKNIIPNSVGNITIVILQNDSRIFLDNIPHQQDISYSKYPDNNINKVNDCEIRFYRLSYRFFSCYICGN